MTVTVGELIAYLSKFDGDTPVLIWQDHLRCAVPVDLERDIQAKQVGEIGRGSFRETQWIEGDVTPVTAVIIEA
ncbi:hypothetical protein EVB87_048 [Rhizobium phage RHph_N28_1]|nr:hypothetical protein EVB87_048 [Rhizobium phage RHph_N28_1]QIG74076.1 hypothetical protein EVC07_048 [Rhizobium phage RHph_N42]QXV73736.1 hypothetical protein [Rhizobium phage RHph_N46]